MKRNTSRGRWFLVGMLVSTNGFAEEYDVEIDLAFDRTTSDGSQLITTPDGTIFSSRDTDTERAGRVWPLVFRRLVGRHWAEGKSRVRRSCLVSWCWLFAFGANNIVVPTCRRSIFPIFTCRFGI